MNRMNTPRVAITGGTSGLGVALVRELRRRGFQVAFVARTRERVDQIARDHPGTHGIVGDIASKDDIHRIALQITTALGGLDVLVNNASSLGPTPLALLADTECEDFALALEPNILAPFPLTTTRRRPAPPRPPPSPTPSAKISRSRSRPMSSAHSASPRRCSAR